MAIRSASDVIYVLIARLPILLFLLLCTWFVVQGLTQLEMYSFGTEVFVGNDETTNQLPRLRGGAEDVLAEALASGDTARMEAALATVEAQGAAASGAQAAVPLG